MKSMLSILALSWVLLPVSAEASPPVSTTEVAVPDSSGLMIEIGPAVEQGDSLQRRLKAAGLAVLANETSPLAADERIHFLVTGALWDYKVKVSVLRGDVTLEEKPLVCECTTTELTERIEAEIQSAAALLAVGADSGSDATPETVTDAKPSVVSLDPTPKPSMLRVSPQTMARTNAHPAPKDAVRSAANRRGSPEPARDKEWQMRFAGLGTLLAGSSFLIASVGLLAADSTELIDHIPHYERNWRPLGFVLGGVGIAGVSVGGSLLLVSEVRCRRRPDMCPTSRRSTMAAVSH